MDINTTRELIKQWRDGNRTSLHIAADLAEQIIDGKYERHQGLPNSEGVARDRGVTHSHVRDAKFVLFAIGLVYQPSSGKEYVVK